MLNPFAHEYTPASAFPSENNNALTRDQTAKKKKKTDNKPTKKKPNVKPETSSTHSSKDKQPANNKTNKHPQNNSKARRKSSQQQQQSIPDMFEKESKFITIEAAIDPIRKIDIVHSNSIHSSSTRAQEKQLFEHGYERYIDWINRSLRLYDTVTLIGMDNAIIDIVSLVTILYDRKIGVYDDVETFSMETETNHRITACIQVKLHPYD